MTYFRGQQKLITKEHLDHYWQHKDVLERSYYEDYCDEIDGNRGHAYPEEEY